MNATIFLSFIGVQWLACTGNEAACLTLKQGRRAVSTTLAAYWTGPVLLQPSKTAQ